VETAQAAGDFKPVPSSGLEVAGSTKDRLTLTRPKGTAGYVRAIELHLFDDEAKAYDALVDSSVDWASVPREQLGAAATRFGTAAYAPFHAELFFGINAASSKYADPRFRLAIMKAFDRTAIVQAVYADLGDPLNEIVPAGVAGHTADPCGPVCAPDPARARALVGEVFGTNPVPEVMIDFDDSPNQRAVAAIIEQNLEAAGIPASQRPKPFAEYQTFAASGQQELFSFGWIGLYNSPDAYLTPLFRGGARDNVTGFGDASVDLRLAGARSSADPAARADFYRRVEMDVLASAVIVPLVQFRTQVAVAKRVRGLTTAVDGTFRLADVWLADGK
jgi:oligopeptide transport system substrate-binding protein